MISDDLAIDRRGLVNLEGQILEIVVACKGWMCAPEEPKFRKGKESVKPSTRADAYAACLKLIESEPAAEKACKKLEDNFQRNNNAL